MYDLIYIYLCQLSFESLNCYKNTDNTWSYFNNPQVRCYQPEWWNKYMPFTFLSIVIYVLPFPILIAYFIYQSRTQMGNPSFVERYNTIFQRFKPEKSYWMSILVARKFFITFAILAITSNPVIQTTLTLVVIISCLLLHVYNQPYRYSFL